MQNHILLGADYTDLWFKNFDDTRSVSLLRLAGGIAGATTAFFADPREGNSVVVLSNYDPPGAVNVAEEIMDLLKSV